MAIAVISSLLFGVVSNWMAILILEGTVWERIVTSTIPLVMLCILIMPFLGKNKNR
jgi:hypothetical protein